jgi:hypothetical protein
MTDTTRFPEATSVHPKKAILCSRKEEDKAVLTSCYALTDRRVDGLRIYANRVTCRLDTCITRSLVRRMLHRDQGVYASPNIIVGIN